MASNNQFLAQNKSDVNNNNNNNNNNNKIIIMIIIIRHIPG